MKVSVVISKQSFSIADLTAGFCVAGLLLPEAVAYSGLAHLSVPHALTASIIGLLIYALFGGSRFAVVAPTSSSATMTAAAALSVPFALGGNASAYQSAFFAVVLAAGGILIALALAKQGQLSSYVSRPVLRGFAFGLALTIVIKQLPDALGVHVPATSSGDPLHVLVYVLQSITHWHWLTLCVALVAWLGVAVFKHWPKLPASMIVIVLAIVAAYVLDLKALGVEEVGEILRPSFQFVWPDLELSEWLQVTELAVGLVVLVFAESWGSMRTMALTHGDTLNANRELLVLGACNVGAACFQGMPVGAGFSATSANAAAGAVSRASGLIACGVIILALFLALPYLHYLPRPVLAVVVISALWHALSLKPLMTVWRMNRDRLLIVVAAIAVLMFGVLHGMLTAIALSLLAALQRFSEPVVHELGELGDTRNFISMVTQPNAQALPHMLILRPEEPLFFGSAERVMSEIIARIQTSNAVQTIVLSLEESSDLDSTAVECLLELQQRLNGLGIRLVLARVKDTVRDLLVHLDPNGLGRADHLYWSVADAAHDGLNK